MTRERSGRARGARSRPLAPACALAFLILLVCAPSAMAVPVNVAPPDTPARSGRTLSTDNGSWLLATTYSYGWYRCDGAGGNCRQVLTRTSSTYLLTTADIGTRIRSIVVATNAVGSEAAVSPPTGVIAAAPPVNEVPPAISGSARIGETLSSSLGNWSDPSPTTVIYSRQWQRCGADGFGCENITNANGASYTPGLADGGKLLRVAVSANGLGVATVFSAPVGPLPDAPASGRGPGGTNDGRDTSTPPGSPRKLRPFPVVVVAGRLLRGRTVISRLAVRGPRGATVSVRCRGRGCPRRGQRTKLRRSGRLRLRRFQRSYRAGAVIEIRITGRNAIGKYTQIRIRARRPPSRRDSCLAPGASRPSRCP